MFKRRPRSNDPLRTALTGSRVIRTPIRKLSLNRLLGGGRINDLGRMPRYAAILIMGTTLIWAPISGYLANAPLRYDSGMSLILPGAGATASVNLAEIGQASSYASSAFASPSVSPTETYKRLIAADRIVAAAARSMGRDMVGFGRPRIELVDQTGLIHVTMTGSTPEEAREKGEALLAAFFAELDALRADEVQVRQDGGLGAIDDYRTSVATTRADIAALQAETGLTTGSQYHGMVDRHAAQTAILIDMGGQLAQAQEAVRSLESTLGMGPTLAALTLRLHADTALAAMITDAAAQAVTLSEARSAYGPRHPQVVDAEAAYAAARAVIDARVQAITGLDATAIAGLDLSPGGARADLLAALVKAEAERAGLAAEYQSLQARHAEEGARLTALAPAAARLEDMQRDFAVAEAVFASAMARSQTGKADIYASYPLVQILENPSLPFAPTSPQKKLAIAAGGAGTFMLIFSLVLGWLRRPLIGRILTRPTGENSDKTGALDTSGAVIA